jgi:hypothetical protein
MRKHLFLVACLGALACLAFVVVPNGAEADPPDCSFSADTLQISHGTEGYAFWVQVRNNSSSAECSSATIVYEATTTDSSAPLTSSRDTVTISPGGKGGYNYKWSTSRSYDQLIYTVKVKSTSGGRIYDEESRTFACPQGPGACRG